MNRISALAPPPLRRSLVRGIAVPFVVVCCQLMAIPDAIAETIVPPPADWGWIKANGEDQTIFQPQFPRFSNYIVGLGCCADGGARIEIRNFFVFEIPVDLKSIESATLRIWNPRDGYNSTDLNESVSLFDVVLPIDEMMEGGSGLHAYFNDLGEGQEYGSAVVGSQDLEQYVDVTLNSTALQDILAARGQLWAIGGRMTSMNTTDMRSQTVFGNTPDYFGRGLPNLAIVGTRVPEPSILALLAIGCAAIGCRRRR